MDQGTERWIKHYSSNHKILLVGEGNFSFSLCLAKAFGSACNITATSLDTFEELERLYGRVALENVEELRALGCTIFHGINVHTMSRDLNLRSKSYDRIVFNFPHAGFDIVLHQREILMIGKHQELVRGFIRNARELVRVGGEIHITHKTAYPFSKWEIVDLAVVQGFRYVEEATFNISDYPGYVNVRGSGDRCSSSFPVGTSSTFIFRKFD